MEMVFKARPGFRLRGPVEVVAGRIEQLKAESGGRLEPGTLVADSNDPDSALHPEFADLRDDADVARRARIHRAQTLMDSYVRIYVQEDGSRSEPILGNVRVTERVETPDGPMITRSVYMSPEHAFRDPDQRQQVFRDADRYIAGAVERLRLLRVADAADLALFDRMRRVLKRRGERRPAKV